MLVSYKWLNEYLDLSQISPKELGDKMSVTGIEVEGIEVPAEGLKKIVVGKVEKCIPHPNSDHLSICQVDIGEEELSQIVCGAPNVKEGIKVIVALPGARIDGNVKIKKGKMRGEVSNGMICSLQELGISENVIPKEFADGIYYLPQDAVVGESVFPYLDLDDSIIELSITPNRADALSMRGVAYEVGAIYNQKPQFENEDLVESNTAASDKIKVRVTDEKDAPAYQIRIIENVKIAPSPQWLQNRLMNEGIRPINNVVDVTNYILLLFGQPLHAFDYAKLGSQEILVRRANEEETLVTLDGEKRKLTQENIVITNGTKPVALAGVMGGLDSEITAETTTVALEAALFDPLSIRLTSKQFNLRSESSARFEKGINKGDITKACDAAAALIAKLAGGTVLNGSVIGSTIPVKDAVVEISLAKINRALGTNLSVPEVGEVFDALQFSYIESDERFTVTIPPRRWDIHIEADIIEEVARIYGYDKIPSTLPSGQTVAGALTKEQLKTREVRNVLEGAGVTEAISYALTTEEKSRQFMMRQSNITRLDWPMTEDRAVLRMNLISGLLDDVAYNVARKNERIALYEIGRVFYQDTDPLKNLPVEENHVAFALSGLWQTKDWHKSGEKVDFFLAKGIVETLLATFGVKDVSFEKTTAMKEMHPGQTAEIYLGSEKIGFVGQIHPTVAKTYDIGATFVAELNLVALLAAEKAPLVYQPISKFPTVTRDIAMVVKEAIANQDVVAAIKTAAGKFLEEVTLFDVYQGTNIKEGYKSLAYSLTFVNTEATLTDEEINKAMEKVTKNLTEKLAAELR
ncbi:phenylalanine--tRNA ligase beta subunit [Enterococcus saigonensis]|uniref:Phenylalanine--tRNA ligase beta subunit n=1 Tax=Enterococcus saigonensis TaxID=1805431 RepID=A0A679IK10_9ENTE|nr:phenylalanine--tRNA ligase subunit beta [Enterococcus saigonensis]BCA85865.1 phenylalanine--tRNA ligase beta subunit [Enterococcus saigonensis]